MTAIQRGTLVSFDAATYKALVMLAGSLGEVELQVGEWVPKSFLAADDEVAVLFLGALTDYDDAVVLGPFGAAAALLAITGTPTNGQVPIGSTASGALALATLTGTANQVTVTNGANAITLSAPQNLHSGASPTFTGLTLSSFIRGSTASAGRAYHDANQSIANDSLTVLNFNQDRSDDDAYPDPVTNNSRLTAPAAGWYLITASVEFGNDADGYRQVQFRVDGSTVIMQHRQPSAGGSVSTIVAAATLYKLTAGQYVECQVRHTAGASINVLSTANSSPEFAMARLC